MIRFKIKLNSKAINMGLFYGALVGMSCGVDQSKLGYVAVFFFGMFQLCVVGIAKLGDRAKVALNRKKIANRKSAADAMIITKAMTQPRPGAAPNATQAPLD